MLTLIARHRAAVGFAALAAGCFYYGLPEETGDAWLDLAMAVVDLAMLGLIIAGGWALFTSPYTGIIYREAPLKRAQTGISDLDERELALRDRAHGLTYYVFATANLLLLLAVAGALHMDWLVLDAGTVFGAILPYCYFSLGLPVLMLEWFEPSSHWAAPIEEEGA